MIHNRNQNTRFRSRTDCFYCIIVEEIKIFCNLVNYFRMTRFRSLTNCLCCIVVKETKILFNLDINKYVFNYF